METPSGTHLASSSVLERAGVAPSTLPVGAAPPPPAAPDAAVRVGRFVTDGRVKHSSLLVMAPILSAEALVELRDIVKPGVMPFENLGSVHFGRILIHEASAAAPPRSGISDADANVRAKLVFATDFDGTVREHLYALVDNADDSLEELFRRCEGWQSIKGRSGETQYEMLAAFVERHAVRANAFYSGTLKRSVGQILREAQLRERIEAFLDERIATRQLAATAVEIRQQIINWVCDQVELKWAVEPAGSFPSNLLPAVGIDFLFARPGIAALVVLLILSALLSLVLPWGWVAAIVATLGGVALAAWLYVRVLSKRDPVIIGDVRDHTNEMVRFEDHFVQNQLTTLSYIKRPVWFRRLVLQSVLWLVNIAARTVSREGKLSDIPSIHFARWAVVDEGRRLLFFSNFDGSFESYLGDFVDKAAKGLTAIWSNCVGFPKTKGLSEGGASDEQRFKAIARQDQVHTTVWWPAYPDLTVANVNDNSRLRLGLRGTMNEREARAWLRMAEPRRRLAPPLEVAKEPPNIDAADVQGLVARSYKHLHHACYVTVTLPEREDRARAWLRDLIPVVTPATSSNDAVAAEGRARNVAFTHAGLQQLGLGNAVGFSREFIDGLAGAGTEHRQRLLGDTGDAAPGRWEWGGPNDGRLHAVLFLFANGADELARIVSAEQVRAQRHDVILTRFLDTNWLRDDKEHFGFHDGIAQPRITGFTSEEDRRGGGEIPTGEVLLGYRNAYKHFPLSPTVPDDANSAELPQLPESDATGRSHLRDLGRNGSYVVFRQLEQDVLTFWETLSAHARPRPDAPPDPGIRKRLAAKMVGRWPNGTPLIEHADAEPPEFDKATGNTFMYRCDLDGDRCPVGSHIRRTNPRDGMHPNTIESLKVADRHRLLRRGRAYGEPLAESFDPDDILATKGRGDRGKRGLHFICFNTDIGRQFEFVQSAWMNSPKFDGLYRDPDPIAAPHPRPPHMPPQQVSNFTEQAKQIRQRCVGLHPFVKTVGGAYLFMPGMKALAYLAK